MWMFPDSFIDHMVLTKQWDAWYVTQSSKDDEASYFQSFAFMVPDTPAEFVVKHFMWYLLKAHYQNGDYV